MNTDKLFTVFVLTKNDEDKTYSKIEVLKLEEITNKQFKSNMENLAFEAYYTSNGKVQDFAVLEDLNSKFAKDFIAGYRLVDSRKHYDSDEVFWDRDSYLPMDAVQIKNMRRVNNFNFM